MRPIGMGTRGWSVFAVFCLAAQATLPCGMVFRKDGGKGGLQSASIAAESAIIVWEPESQTETFIRTANFEGEGADFGFIVPSPTEPELSEVGGNVYSTLYSAITNRNPGLLTLGVPRTAGPGGGFGGGGSHVEVIKEQVVSGMKATVLKATDTRALELWLANNEYVATPEVIRWTAFYVQNNYYLTAFKIDRQPGHQKLKSATVKMVFRTKTPFYPYREPASPQRRTAARSLRVYFVGPWLAKARYMDSGQAWEASRMDVDDLSQEEIQRFTDAAKMDPTQMPAEPKLTYFMDTNRTRQDRDVVFERR